MSGGEGMTRALRQVSRLHVSNQEDDTIHILNGSVTL